METLVAAVAALGIAFLYVHGKAMAIATPTSDPIVPATDHANPVNATPENAPAPLPSIEQSHIEIGRASCRERV